MIWSIAPPNVRAESLLLSLLVPPRQHGYAKHPLMAQRIMTDHGSHNLTLSFEDKGFRTDPIRAKSTAATRHGRDQQGGSLVGM